MNKIYGLKSEFSFVREETTRYVVSHSLSVCEDKEHALWYEIVFYKKQVGKPSFKMVKDAILEDINSQTEYKIASGLMWNDKPVWLNKENQFNFSEGERKAKDNPSILPITYKIGQDSDGNPVYHTFTTVEEITGFYDTCFAYINQCLNEGWQRKDSIDWTPYEEALEPVTE